MKLFQAFHFTILSLQIAKNCMNTADMSFFTRIADPLLTGTYMTLMNGEKKVLLGPVLKQLLLVIYVGSKTFKTFSIWLVDILTWKSCSFEGSHLHNSTGLSSVPNCANELSSKLCSKSGGTCQTIIDGFYIEVAFNIVFGVFWYFWAKKVAKNLQNLPVSDWHVLSNQNLEAEMLPLKTVN